MNLFQWRFMNEFVHRFQWNRYNDFKSACVRFFTFFAININEKWIYYSSDTKTMTWKKKLKNIDSINLIHDQINSFFSFLSSSMRQYFVNQFFYFIFAINQDASINKNSKNSNSKNLKQHTFAKSISFCCFYFCFVRNIDRFIILICKCFREQNFYQNFHSRRRIYLFFFFTFFVFVFIFLRLSHLFWIFLFLSWSNWYLNYN